MRARECASAQPGWDGMGWEYEYSLDVQTAMQPGKCFPSCLMHPQDGIDSRTAWVVAEQVAGPSPAAPCLARRSRFCGGRRMLACCYEVSPSRSGTQTEVLLRPLKPHSLKASARRPAPLLPAPSCAISYMEALCKFESTITGCEPDRGTSRHWIEPWSTNTNYLRCSADPQPTESRHAGVQHRPWCLASKYIYLAGLMGSLRFDPPSPF
ncbi:hypothetical protein F4861DRAFT_235271 [Xylaria intraflava]|nr:hypothetical protein F4861DRAFT_235271 [Xylaria intraflava]